MSDVPEGYKQSGVGVIPEEWEVKTIGEFTSSTAGGTPSTLVPEYWNGDIRWMSSGELNLKKIHEVEGRITEAGLKNSSTKIVPLKCILIGLAGQGKTRGTTAINYVELCTNQSIAAIFPNDSFIPEYLFYNIDSRYKELRNLSTGDGGRGGLNLKIIKGILVPLPTKTEQQAIASALSDVDALITALEQLITKKRNIKQGAMQQLLTGKKRLPGFGGAWEVKKLGEIGKLKNGINKGKEDFGFGYSFVNLLDVFGRRKLTQFSSLGLVNSSIVEREIYDLRKGDVLFIRSSVKPAGVGLTSVVNNDLNDTVYSGFLIRFRDFGKMYLEYKVHCFNEEGFRKKVMDSSTVSANTNINQDALKNLQIKLPPTIEEQQAIIKQGMMQELLTGKRRLA
jgi:type I restriction enzyme S subunit